MSLFQKIIDREIPADIVFEDDLCLAFRDINAQAPTHILVIPKNKIESMATVRPQDKEILGHLMVKCSQIAEQEGLAQDGYRLVVNTNSAAGQTVFHLHIHILGGRAFSWPPG